ncbi:ferrous iron transport protein B [Bifidobacterium minimum]|uniref:Ferrous iron transport protein B n=1 Tax=Bifidobacterium minimum TaxID=1693 RepID=A0A087BNS1_9BIFI|nr:ferrous iron transport protein B [Bifidobacterium minimum]KFI72671.1 ferrous iron transport protein B [Bifidobacterium minimum]
MSRECPYCESRPSAVEPPSQSAGSPSARRDDAPARNGHAAERRIVLVGNPNVGKSSLFNAMLGMHARVMNAPGTTVLLEYGTLARHDGHWNVIDTPGTYSLLPMSPDEKVTSKAVLGLDGAPRPDLMVAVLDATSMSRSLYLLSMVREIGVPLVVALTMNDLARRRSCGIDPSALSKALGGVDVVEVDGRTGAGLPELEDAIERGLARSSVTQADGHVPSEEGLSSWVRSNADRRFDWVAGILSRTSSTRPPRVTASDRIDALLLSPWFGIPAFLVVMYIVFEATTTVAGPIQDWIDVTLRAWLTAGVEGLFSLGGPQALSGWPHSLIVDGVLDGVISVATFIPPMGIMFLLLSILEDSGYLARAAFVMDRAMRALGLDGKAFLPIVVGFGCNLPALAATRSLEDSRQRILVGMLIPFTSCSARLSVYMVLAYAFFQRNAGLVIFLMYVASILLILLVGVALRHTVFHGLRPEPFAMSLPSYQMPKAVTTLRSVGTRLWGFIRGASGIIVTVIVLMWLLQGIPATAGAGSFGDVEDVHDSLYGTVADAVAPVFAPAGFDDWHASAALITGFVAKEVVVGSMSQSYNIDEDDSSSQTDQSGGTLGESIRRSFDASSDGHGRATAIAFLLFVLAYTPCLATVAELRRQFGTRVMGATVVLGLVVAYALAMAAFQLLRLVL